MGAIAASMIKEIRSNDELLGIAFHLKENKKKGFNSLIDGNSSCTEVDVDDQLYNILHTYN